MLNVPMVRKAGHAWPVRFDFSIISLASASPAAKPFVKLGVTSQRASHECTRVSDWVFLTRLIHIHGCMRVHEGPSALAPTLK